MTDFPSSPVSETLRAELSHAICRPNNTTGVVTLSKQLDAVVAIFERFACAQCQQQWVQRENKERFPAVEGWYRVMVSGDSESIDGHTIYAFDDYETWAHFTPHEDGGSFVGTHDEDEHTIFAYFGPIAFPEYVYEEATVLHSSTILKSEEASK